MGINLDLALIVLLVGLVLAALFWLSRQQGRSEQAGEDRAAKEGALENLRKVRAAADARARVDHSPDGVLRDPDRRD